MKINEITCISDLYYCMGRWFTILMVTLAFCILPLALDAWDSVFSFLMCGGIAFVGVASNYRDKTEYPVHVVSAMVSAICSMLWVSHFSLWPLALLLISAMGLVDKERWLLWCEVSCFVMVFVQLIQIYHV